MSYDVANSTEYSINVTVPSPPSLAIGTVFHAVMITTALIVYDAMQCNEANSPNHFMYDGDGDVHSQAVRLGAACANLPTRCGRG